MQKHRKYLVITIWISTIAFVGAGFVGWGTYQYGSKSNSVAKVGDIPITLEEFQRAYGDAFNRYNRMMGGRLDEATAKKLGLQQQALQSLIYQALIENFAESHGIVVSDEEVQQAILAIPAFQKDGHFDKATYLAVLQNMRMKPKTFEASLKKDLLIQKTLALLSPDAVPLEVEALGSALFMADRLRYKIFSDNDVHVTLDEAALKKFWEAHKNDYMTPKRYKLAILWVTPGGETPSDEELAAYYKEHRTDFTDEKGEILPLDEVKERVALALRLKKAKKRAQLAYIDLKKGRKAPQQTKVFDAGDAALTPELWEAIEGATPGTVLKPKIVGDRYAVVKVEEAILPRPETFEEAYDAVKADYLLTKRREALKELAQKASENLTDGIESPFVTRDDVAAFADLDNQEASTFLKALFESGKKSGAVLLGDKAVAYTIVEQRLLDKEKLSQYDTLVRENAKKIKADLIQTNLITQLQKEYPIEIYLKDSE
ncbi:peptidylprolyl isomerase [Hydrogenimonas sp.]